MLASGCPKSILPTVIIFFIEFICCSERGRNRGHTYLQNAMDYKLKSKKSKTIKSTLKLIQIGTSPKSDNYILSNSNNKLTPLGFI